MNKLKYIIFIMLISLSFTSVNAANIKSSSYDGKFTISGTATETVQIVLFDLDNKPIYLTTANIEDGKFSITLPEISGLKNGNYKIKVADYNGTNADAETINVSIDNPKTVDNIVSYLIITFLTVVAIISTIAIAKKKLGKSY